MKERPTAERFESEYAGLVRQFDAGSFVPADWMLLINRMRIWGYGVRADEIVEHLRKIKDTVENNIQYVKPVSQDNTGQMQLL